MLNRAGSSQGELGAPTASWELPERAGSSHGELGATKSSWELRQRAGSSQSELGAHRAGWELPERAGSPKACKLSAQPGKSKRHDSLKTLWKFLYFNSTNLESDD